MNKLLSLKNDMCTYVYFNCMHCLCLVVLDELSYDIGIIDGVTETWGPMTHCH